MPQFQGELRLFPATCQPPGWRPCEGQVRPISQSRSIFSLIGATWGGDGLATLHLPLVRPVGGPAGLRFLLCVEAGPGPILAVEDDQRCILGPLPPGAVALEPPMAPPGRLIRAPSPAPQIGELRLFVGITPPPGWFWCAGGRLEAEAQRALADQLGGVVLPDLRPHLPPHPAGARLGYLIFGGP